MARWRQGGSKVADKDIRFPFKLSFVPLVSLPNTKRTWRQILDELTGFTAGTQLMDVYACGSPAREHGAGEGALPLEDVASSCGDPIFLGQLVAASKCTTSHFGDTRLDINHQRIEEDWELKLCIIKSYEPYVMQTCAATRMPVSRAVGLRTWMDTVSMCQKN